MVMSELTPEQRDRLDRILSGGSSETEMEAYQKHDIETRMMRKLAGILDEIVKDGFFVFGGPHGEILLQGWDNKLVAALGFNRELNSWVISDMRYELKEPYHVLGDKEPEGEYKEEPK